MSSKLLVCFPGPVLCCRNRTVRERYQLIEFKYQNWNQHHSLPFQTSYLNFNLALFIEILLCTVFSSQNQMQENLLFHKKCKNWHLTAHKAIQSSNFENCTQKVLRLVFVSLRHENAYNGTKLLGIILGWIVIGCYWLSGHDEDCSTVHNPYPKSVD